MSSLRPGGVEEERALIEAIQRNDTAKVTHLIDAGVSPDGPPLHEAILRGRHEIITLLLQHEVHDVTRHAETLLHFAAGKRSVWVKEQAEEDDTVLLKYLIAGGADVNALASLGMSPLWYAVQADNLPAVRELLAASADIQLRNIYGETVLHEAAYHQMDRFSTARRKLVVYCTRPFLPLSLLWPNFCSSTGLIQTSGQTLQATRLYIMPPVQREE